MFVDSSSYHRVPTACAGGSWRSSDAAKISHSSVSPISAAAPITAACLSAFPIIIDHSASTPNQSSATASRKSQRANELNTCLNQWNDYTPSLVRSFLNSQLEDRLAADIRFDYRLTDSLKVYAKYAIANRKVDDQTLNRTLGQVDINPTVRAQPGFVDSPPPTQRS